MIIENIQCPFCSQQAPKKIWKLKKYKGAFKILWCNRCGFGWQHPLPSKNNLEKLYKTQDLYHEKIVDENQGGFPKRVDRLNELKPSKGNLLDVGSGMGHFINHAKNAGWKIAGVEPRHIAADYCHKHFGIEVFNGQFEDWQNNHPFDIITLWDVLEHVHNPFGMLAKCYNMLSPEGILVISIPNSSGTLARVMKGDWRYVMFPHVSYFTMPFIKNMLSYYNLRILRMDHTLKIQSIFEAFISLLPKRINPERVYKITYQNRNGFKSKPDIISFKNLVKKELRKAIYNFNTMSFSLPVGDIVDIYCQKN